MKPLVVIPARGGSKGVPRKNLKELNGKPLLLYTLEAALNIFDKHIICVSTDDVQIKECAETVGVKVPFLRPVGLSGDTSGTYEVLLHAIEYYEANGYFPDTLVLLQPTSPFRNSNHIKEALSLYNQDMDMLVSVRETKSNPYYILFEEDDMGYLQKSKQSDYTRRQDCPPVWEFNGAIYIINIKSLKEKTMGEFKKVQKYVMDELSSHDIDTMFDWEIAQLLAKKI